MFSSRVISIFRARLAQLVSSLTCAGDMVPEYYVLILNIILCLFIIIISLSQILNINRQRVEFAYKFSLKLNYLFIEKEFTGLNLKIFSF